MQRQNSLDYIRIFWACYNVWRTVSHEATVAAESVAWNTQKLHLNCSRKTAGFVLRRTSGPHYMQVISAMKDWTRNAQTLTWTIQRYRQDFISGGGVGTRCQSHGWAAPIPQKIVIFSRECCISVHFRTLWSNVCLYNPCFVHYIE